jgi:hypothetical protein
LHPLESAAFARTPKADIGACPSRNPTGRIAAKDFSGKCVAQRVAIDFAGPANEIIGVGARGEYCGSGHDKKGKRASQEN